MQRFKTEALGEIPLFVVKGAVAEFEFHFGKPVFEIISTGFLEKHWRVMAFECYKSACHKEKSAPKFSVSNFIYDLSGSELTEIVKYLDAQLDTLLGISELVKAFNEAQKKAEDDESKKK